jgi:hypothetical protein
MARMLTLMLLLVLASAASGAPETEVVIGVQGLDPPVLEVLPDERVIFVNRSGRSVHIDFVGDGRQHHVFHVSGAIWATFHRHGRHPYTVHFDDRGGGLLRGVIDVTQESVSEAPPRCPSVRVMSVCLEP